MRSIKFLVFLMALQINANAQTAAEAQAQAMAQASGQQTQVVNKVINYNDAPLNIAGEVQEEIVTDGELEYINGEIRKQKRTNILNKEKTKGYQDLQKTTEKLVDSTEDYMEERKTSEAKIKEYNKKIKCLLEENRNSRECNDSNDSIVEDKVQVVQAAPQPQQVVAEIEPTTEASMLEDIKIVPLAGIKTYEGGNLYGVESNGSFGLRVESEVFNNFVLGFEGSYHSVDFADFGSTFGNTSLFNQNRAVNMQSFNLNALGKFYFLDGRIRPYVGASVGFKRVLFEYTQNNNFGGNNFGNLNFGNESITNNLITGELLVGADLQLTKSIGLVGEFSYGRGLTDFGSSQANILFLDEIRLQQLSDEFTSASSLGIHLGVYFTF